MMQAYAGPVQQGDMVVRANEVSPGITALLSKQTRKGAQGIYELPTAKPANPDYYNMALENVQNNLRSAAQTVNALAPQGERLAYINPQEEGILRLLGGSGEPEPVTGIPSFAGFRGFTGYKDSSKAVNQPTTASKKSSVGQPTGPANTQFQQNAAGLAAAIKEQTGPAYADQAKKAITSFIGSAGSKGGKYDPVQAAQALVDISKSGSAEQQALAKQENKALVNALKYSLGSYDYGGKNLFGFGDGFSLGDKTKNILRAAQTYGQLPRDKNLGEKAIDLISNFSILGKLFGGGKKLEDMSIAELTEFYNKQDEMRRQEEARRDRGDSKPTPTQEEATEETADEEELPYFNWYRKFKLPMTYEDIIKRAYQGSTGPLLETYKEAIDKAKK